MKKIFFVAGEVSGDRIGAWYYTLLQKRYGVFHAEAIGGKELVKAGVTLYRDNADLNLVGIVEIMKHLPRIVRLINNLVSYIINNHFDEIVLVDFPGFNLRLARLLKKRSPALHITYCSPPQLWAWGAWRVKKIKRYIDEVVVIYPFEVAWYKARGVDALWHGYPWYEEFMPYAALPSDAMVARKKKRIALIPGSRPSELEALIPLYADTMKKVAERYAEIEWIVPCAASFSPELLIEKFSAAGAPRNGVRVVSSAESFEVLSTCAVALSKPGTVTLQLALLGVPTIIAFKVSTLTYNIGKRFVTVPFMGLANLFLNDEISPEFIQDAATPLALAHALQNIYEQFHRGDRSYTTLVNKHLSVHKHLTP